MLLNCYDLAGLATTAIGPRNTLKLQKSGFSSLDITIKMAVYGRVLSDGL